MPQGVPSNPRRSFTAKEIALWSLQIITAAAFFMAGCAKLSGQPAMVQVFDKVGAGQWFRYLTGGIEVAGAVMLLIPRLTPVGAALLACTMIGAVVTHLTRIGGSPVPALVLGCLATIILWARRSALHSLFPRRHVVATVAAEVR